MKPPQTQHQQVVDWILDNGYIVPAKMAGMVYKGIMFGSETSKRCRELRAHKLPSVQKYPFLWSDGEGKFTKYMLKDRVPVMMPVLNIPEGTAFLGAIPNFHRVKPPTGPEAVWTSKSNDAQKTLI